MNSNVVVKKRSFFGRLALVTVTTLALVAGGLPGCAAQEQEQEEQEQEQEQQQEEQSKEAIGQSEQAVAPAWVVLAVFSGVGTVYFNAREQQACIKERNRLRAACKGKNVTISCTGQYSGTNTPASKIAAMCR